MRQAERKLAKSQRALSRKAKGSKNRDKARQQVARDYKRVANQRLNHARQLAARLIRENQTIVVESLNIRGMARSRLAKSITDAGWAQFLAALLSATVENEAIATGENEATQTDWVDDLGGRLGIDQAAGRGRSSAATGR
ncbi:MAG: transposase [Microbacteriaceae bacterium]|nr:transposase [Microbacteriaceae bacterium]